MAPGMKKIHHSNFFWRLTQRNWGWPYHLIIAWLASAATMKWGLALSEWFTLFMAKQLGSFEFFNLQPVFISVILLVGLGYEIYQTKKENQTGREFIEDTIANWIGIILGVLL